MPDKRIEARSRGSDGQWRVLRQYCIDDGILREGQVWPGGRSVQGPICYYYPFAHPELVTNVASLKKGDERAVLDFACQWGLQGYDDLILYHPGWLEPDDKGELVTRTEERKGGDPLPWIWAHAETVRRILRLIRLLAKCRDAESSYDKDTRQAEAPVRELETYLASIASPFSGMPPLSSKTGDSIYTHFDLAIGIEPIETLPDIRVASGVTVGARHHPEEEWDRMTPQMMAERIVADVLNGNLHGVEPLVRHQRFEASGLDRYFAFPSLLSAVYWHLSDAAIGINAYIQCQWRGCGKWIQQEHGHQRYCPPKEEGKESLCSLKARQYRWEQSHRGARP